VTHAQSVVGAMTDNPHFPAPLPALWVVSKAVSDLRTAETAALTRAQGTIDTRNDERRMLVSLLHQLRAYVQVIADADPRNGAFIIESAGLAVRKRPARRPRVFSAKPGAESGEVKLIAPSAGHRSAYEWEYSIDGGATWLAMAPTLQAKTSITGLTPGSSVQFKYRWVDKSGASSWSQPITMPTVK
jgi:hypothetical protein